MELIKKSLDLLNKNMIMIVPFLLQFVLMIGVAFVSIMGISLWVAASGVADDFYGIEQAMVLLQGTYPILMTVGLLLVVSSMLIQSFVMSGVVGMGKEAMEKGETSLSDFFVYGKKYFLKVLLIELMGTVASLLVMVPMFFYLILNLGMFLMADSLPIGFILLYLVTGFIGAVVYFVAHFSIVPLIKGDLDVWGAVKSSVKILPKGLKDCMVLLGITILVLIMFLIVALGLAFIPVIGQLIVSAIQLYLIGVIIIWTLVFYEKHHDLKEELISLDKE